MLYKRLQVRSLERGVTSYYIYKGYHSSRLLMNMNNVFLTTTRLGRLRSCAHSYSKNFIIVSPISSKRFI